MQRVMPLVARVQRAGAQALPTTAASSHQSSRRSTSLPSLVKWGGFVLVVYCLHLIGVGKLHASPRAAKDTSAAAVAVAEQLMGRLSRSDTLIATLERLYAQYGGEIREVREEMTAWCAVTQSCKFCDLEIEMLYMLVREWRPASMFEMAPDHGYSTRWILRAMRRNHFGTLHSFDIKNDSLPFVHSRRWRRR